MSKSLNNFFTGKRNIRKIWCWCSKIIYMLSAHYRAQLNFSEELLQSAKSALERLYNAIYNLENLSMK